MNVEMKKAKRKVSPEGRVRSEINAENMHFVHPSMTLSQARWSEHRKKIGLSPLSKNSHSFNIPSYDDMKQELIITVRENFKRKECVRFVPKHDPKRKKDDPIKCYCGEVPERHIKNIAGVSEFFQHGVDATSNDLNTGKMTAEWNPKKDIVELSTNGFGKIEFVHEGLGGRKPSKYLRLKDDTEVDQVIDFLTNHWRMLSPIAANLVITVIGGAKNFKLDGKKKEVFNRGLVNAAQTTHAWIITSGCNMGVMKAVGEAVAEGQSYNWDKMGMTHSLRCIGIAPWGYVERNTALISNDGFGSWNASYKVNNTIRHGHPVSLNPNHTHFLLVDDGLRRRYGGVAGFRARLERKISLPSNPEPGHESGLGIPVVLVVVEGGYDALDDVYRSLEAKIPVVVCEGTGRAADILAYASRNFVTTRKGERVMKEKHKVILDMKLCDAYGKTWAAKSNERKEADKYLKIVLQCCQDEKLMTVFDLNKHEDLDLAILSALLKGQGAKNLDQLHDQLRLALTWNRSDVAEEKIFTQDVNWPTGSLDDIMTDALIDNKVDFVRLLLQNGVVMKEYLTVPRLRKLYNSAPKLSHLRTMLQANTRYPSFTLRDVGKLLRKLMSKHDDEIYNSDDDMKRMMSREEAIGENEIVFPRPFRELFLWAVLMNRQDLARFLWERGDEAIPSAIAASRIYGSLADYVSHYDSDLRDMYQKHKDQFEKLAVRVLEECHNTDPEKSAMLIERKYQTWGGTNCLEMAAAADDREFLSTVCCQNSLNLMWKRGIASQSIAVFFGLICPPLIWLRVRFQNLGDADEQLNWWQKTLTFYRAPVTKFAANVLMYLVFLVYYSYVILFDFRETITINEKIVLCWIFTSLLEEIRQMFRSSNADSLKERMMDWWNFSVFNRIDIFILIIAIIGFGMRFNQDLFNTAKALYCVNAVLFFIRLLREYSASSSLGPKLVMITTMMKELLLYIMILGVFLLAYGVSTQALMYPIREPYVMIIKDIFYYPYWQIYGELFLEELEGRTSECTNSTMMMDGVTPCPTYHWMVPALTAAYLLVGNLLLLNILIAIFNHVFNEIQTNSIQIWKYGMYFLVVEYDNKPALAPPFIILEHIGMFIKWLICKACCKQANTADIFTEKMLAILKVYEKEMLKLCLQKQQLAAKDNLSLNIRKIMNRVDEMAKQIEEERLLEQQHYEAEQNKLDDTEKLDDSLQYPTCSLNVKSPRRRSQYFPENYYVEKQDQLQDNLNVKFNSNTTVKKYSRWPSLEKIKWLKKQQDISKMEAIREDQSSAMGGETTGLDSICSSDQDTTINWGSQGGSGHGEQTADSPGKQDEHLYDSLRLARPRVFMDPTYDHIVSAKVQNTESSVSTSANTKSGKHERKKYRKRKPEEPHVPGNGEGDEGKSSRRRTRKSDPHPSFPNNAWDNVAFSGSESSGEDVGVQREMEKKSQGSEKRKVPNVEERLKKLEETTQTSLYNIEALLRNAVFYGGSGTRNLPPSQTPPPHTPENHRSRPTSRSKPRPYAYRHLDEDQGL